MNFLGKAFVFIVLVLSIMFMTFAIAVYATHKNWRELAQGLQTQLTQAQTRYTQLQAQHDRQVEELQAEQLAAQRQVSALETERSSLVERNAGIEQELVRLRDEQAQHTAAFTATQELNEGLSEQVTALSQQLRDSEQARDVQYAQMLAATEQRNQLVGQLESVTQRNMQLTSQVADLTTVMRAAGVDPNTDPSGVVEPVDGVVLAIRRSGGDQFVEVSIGADDGLKPGHTVEVFRGSKYLGRLDILETSPDKAVGRVNRRFQLGAIQEQDRVATQLIF